MPLVEVCKAGAWGCLRSCALEAVPPVACLVCFRRALRFVSAGDRASELFDWLRGLPENHELAHLCDVYTYTTIISQCGSHQQLRKALELVAEMRGHGIMCNVHTYSALMNVCIKV